MQRPGHTILAGLDDLPPLRAFIARDRLSARAALGQHYLLDLNLLGRIARLAGDLRDSHVLEIGAGPGGLTRALLAAGARHVVAVEKDRRFLPALQAVADACPGRLTLVTGDALELTLNDRLAPPVHIISNLPYNIASALLVRWLTPPEWPPFWTSMTLMFQKEVAKRIVADQGDKSWGRLSVLTRWRSDARLRLIVPPTAFTPPPRVSSAVVRIIPLPAPRFPADADALQAVLARAFGQRRKMLRRALAGFLPEVENRLTSAGVVPTMRAEELSLEQFCALARCVADG